MLDYYRFKEVGDLFSKGRRQEAMQHLAVLQRRYVALCDENTTCKMQMREFEDILYLERNLFFEDGCCWLTTGSIRQGPFCPDCYNRDGLLMRLMGERHERYCPTCRKQFAAAPLPGLMATAIDQDYWEPPSEDSPPAAASQGSGQPQASARRATIIPFGK